jgi:hypothetical protein
MSRNEFDERTDYEEWCDAVDCALRTHRVGSTAFTDCERLAAFNEGYGADECAENFARAYYAALVGYDEPTDYDDDTDSFDPDSFDAFIESEGCADGC